MQNSANYAHVKILHCFRVKINFQKLLRVCAVMTRADAV